MVSRSTRCVTIDYADDFHLDVVPIIQNSSFIFATKYQICNRKDNIFERTDGPGFEDWLGGKNEIVGDNQLVQVIRLLKYMRDIKGRFSCKSILLTTLIGEQVRDSDSKGFDDLSSALMFLMGRLDDFLKENPNMPIIENPALSDENFNRHWDAKKYMRFRSQISMYRDWIDDAYAETDPKTSIIKWRRVLGGKFAKSVDFNDAKFIAQCKNELMELEEKKSGYGGLIASAAVLVLLALKG